MAYTYGTSRLAKARNEHDEAEAKALELETRALELKAQNLARELKELEEARNRAIGIYPTDPDWYRHRIEADAEITAHNRAKRLRNRAVAVSGRGVAYTGGGIAA